MARVQGDRVWGLLSLVQAYTAGSVLSAALAGGIGQVAEFSSANVGRKKSTFYGFTTIKFYCKVNGSKSSFSLH